MSARFHIVKEFGFEAAHSFGHKPAGHENTRVHGHSFRVEVALAGAPDAATGCVVDFEILTAALNKVRGAKCWLMTLALLPNQRSWLLKQYRQLRQT